MIYVKNWVQAGTNILTGIPCEKGQVKPITWAVSQMGFANILCLVWKKMHDGKKQKQKAETNCFILANESESQNAK